jgi:hypothetical protein
MYQRRTIKQSMVDRKRDFDQVQAELEMMVEILSGMRIDDSDLLSAV